MEGNGAKKKLERTYFEMLESSLYSKFTVTDIINRAGVSRTTFYRYYTDIFDMHKKVAFDFADELIKRCFHIINSAQSKDEYFEKIMEIFYSQEKYILLISGKNGSRYFFESLFYHTVEFFNSLEVVFSQDQLFRLKFLTIAFIGIYVKDIIENREHDLEIIEICKSLVTFEEMLGGKGAKDC